MIHFNWKPLIYNLEQFEFNINKKLSKFHFEFQIHTEILELKETSHFLAYAWLIRMKSKLNSSLCIL